MITVDDGSTDHSQELCLSRCQADQRFRLITHSENKGASEARNTGIAHATGDYVLFLDNDDWWEGEDALQQVFEAAQKGDFPDLICYPMGEYLPHGDRLVLPSYHSEQEVNNMDDFFERADYLIAKGMFYSSASGKAVRRDLIENNGIAFNTQLKHNEDTEWSHSLLCHANSIQWMDHAFYIYRRNSAVSQSTDSPLKPVIASLASIVNKHARLVHDGTLQGKRMECVSQFMAYIYVLLLAYLFMENSEDNKQKRIEQKSNVWLLNFDANKRVSYARTCAKTIGFSMTGRLLALVMKRERNRIKHA